MFNEQVPWQHVRGQTEYVNGQAACNLKESGGRGGSAVGWSLLIVNVEFVVLTYLPRNIFYFWSQTESNRQQALARRPFCH